MQYVRAGPDEMLKLRWNSQSGAVYVDGQHFKVSRVRTIVVVVEVVAVVVDPAAGVCTTVLWCCCLHHIIELLVMYM